MLKVIYVRHMVMNMNIKKALVEELIKAGYIYISSEQAQKRRRIQRDVLLKDILRFKLVELNNYIYNEQEYKFTYLSINQAIIDLDAALTDGLEVAQSTIKNLLMYGSSYENVRIDETKGTYFLKYIDRDNLPNNEFHVVEDYLIQKSESDELVCFDVVLFINGIPFAVITSDETQLPNFPQLMKFSPSVLQLKGDEDISALVDNLPKGQFASNI